MNRHAAEPFIVPRSSFIVSRGMHDGQTIAHKATIVTVDAENVVVAIAE